VLILSVFLTSCLTTEPKKLSPLYQLNFDDKEDLSQFKVETQISNNEVQIKDGALDINAVKGATVWFKEKLFAPLEIEYKAVVVDEGGSNDRVSDLNCFFMALDPFCPGNILNCPDSLRTGKFRDYHRLRTYYVGYGGNDNTTTRMRRYPGFSGERPMLPEHDKGYPELISPNDTIAITIKVNENNITYSHYGKVIFKMNDPLPYQEGWFAFRTVRNHLKILDFKVYQIIN
jgi:hypothetical protein